MTKLRSGYTAGYCSDLSLPEDEEEHRKKVRYEDTDMKVGLLFLAASLVGVSGFTYGMFCCLYSIQSRKRCEVSD